MLKSRLTYESTLLKQTQVKTARLISESALGRKLDLHQRQVETLRRLNLLVPDEVSGTTRLYGPEAIAALRPLAEVVRNSPRINARILKVTL